MEGTFRNKFVIDRHVEGLGWNTFTVIATKEDLAALSESIREVADGKDPVYHYVTLAHGNTAREQIIFKAATKEGMDELHTPSLRKKAFDFFNPVLIFVVVGIFALAAFGLYSIFK
jgi:hypothetical protein